jgi:hypothetical protein
VRARARWCGRGAVQALSAQLINEVSALPLFIAL